MQIKPTHNFIIIQQAPTAEKELIVLPDGAAPPSAPLQKWDVLAVADATTCCKVGDKVLLAPDTRMIGIDHPAKIVMVHDNVVVGVVTGE
jgi:hypothetical protein